VSSRYKKEFPRLQSDVSRLEEQINLLTSHLEEVREEKVELDKKTFKVIADFAGVQQALLPVEHVTLVPLNSSDTFGTNSLYLGLTRV